MSCSHATCQIDDADGVRVYVDPLLPSFMLTRCSCELMLDFADVDEEDVDIDRVNSSPPLLTAASDTSPTHAIQVSL